MIGHFIQQQRTKRNLTQEDLASELGISRPTFRLIENGKRELTISQAEKLAGKFKMPMANFLSQREPAHDLIIEEPETEEAEGLQIRVRRKDLETFKQVFLYALHKVGCKPNIVKDSLHKLFYFMDFDCYEKYEENLMGATYVKTRAGPEAVELDAIIEELREAGEIEVVTSPIFKGGRQKYFPLHAPNLDAMTAPEMETINDVLARLSDKTVEDLEQYARDDLPCRVKKEGDILSYKMVFYRDRRYSVGNYDDDPL